jgi:Protein of unknown function (DUF2800)
VPSSAKIMPSNHAKYGPSGAQGRDICPGKTGIAGSSEASEQGDRLHAVCEHNGDEAAAAFAYEKDKGKPWIPLTSEELEWVNMALTYVRELPSENVLTEYRIPLTDLGFEGMDFGTVDRLSWSDPRHCDMVDYKFGWGAITDVEKNFQFMIYALGIFDEFPECEILTIHMVQPKLNLVDCHTWTREDFPQLHTIIKASHDKVIEFEKTKNIDLLVLDPINCERCGSQAQCPKFQSVALVTAKTIAERPALQDEDSKLQFTANMVPDLINTNWEITSADPVKVAMMLQLIPALEAAFTKFKKYALEVHNLVGELPGFSVVTTAGKNDCVSPVDVVNVVTEKFGCTREEVIGTMKPSITELKSLVSSKAPRGDKAKYAEALVEILSDNGLIIKQPGTEYLKRKPSKKQ